MRPLVQLDIRVVTDNDEDVAALKTKYSEYLSDPDSTIRICYDPDEGFPTLEPQLLKANSLHTLNEILGTAYEDKQSLLKYMEGHKPDCALKMFETEKPWETPDYIRNAIN